MMTEPDRILELVTAHKNSIVNTIGDNNGTSLYMKGYIDACNNISMVLHAYFRSLEERG